VMNEDKGELELRATDAFYEHFGYEPELTWDRGRLYAAATEVGEVFLVLVVGGGEVKFISVGTY